MYNYCVTKLLISKDDIEAKKSDTRITFNYQARVQTMSRSCPGHAQVMFRSCSGHVQVISIPSPSQISRSGPGADSIIAMPPPPPPTQQTFLSEISQISLQEVKLKHKGRFRFTFEDAHRHGQAKIT